MAGKRKDVPVTHVTLTADGQYLIEIERSSARSPLETLPDRKAAAAQARFWANVYRGRKVIVWHEEKRP